MTARACGRPPSSTGTWPLPASGSTTSRTSAGSTSGWAAGSRPGAARGIRLACDAYGLADRRRVVDVILWWQDRCWRGIEAGAAAADPAMAGLRDAGAVREVQSAYRWVAAHGGELAAALA